MARADVASGGVEDMDDDDDEFGEFEDDARDAAAA